METSNTYYTKQCDRIIIVLNKSLWFKLIDYILGFNLEDVLALTSSTLTKSEQTKPTATVEHAEELTTAEPSPAIRPMNAVTEKPKSVNATPRKSLVAVINSTERSKVDLIKVSEDEFGSRGQFVDGKSSADQQKGSVMVILYVTFLLSLY